MSTADRIRRTSVVSCALAGQRDRSRRGPPSGSSGKFFNDVKNSRNEEDTDGAGRQHAADDSGAHDLASDGAGAGSGPERDAAEDESERGHKDGAKAQARALERRVGEGLTLLKFLFGELDDQNGVLGGEADEHDQADLRIDIAFDL